MSDLYSLRCDAFPAGVELLAFRGSEALNEVYEITLALRVPSAAGFDVDKVIGSRATLEIRAPHAEGPQLVHGLFAYVEHVQEAAGHALYRATLVPQLWHASQGLHSQVFVEQSVPDILRAVLASDGIDEVRFDLAASYPAMAHVCQYQESNLAFVTRWLEREGMYYFFEQGDERETLVITDHKSAHRALAGRPVRYVPGASEDTGVGEALADFRCHARALPANVRFRDYDYKNPKLDVAGSAPVSARGRAEINVHGANFTTPSDGARLAKLKAEELKAHERVFSGHGRVFNLRPGYTFTLDEHPHGAFNAPYLVTSVEHYGNAAASDPAIQAMLDVPYDDEYRVDVAAIPASVQFRPKRRTAWPRIYGYEMATVDGASASAYAQINADGCYKVKIHFDEADAAGAQASTWVRMLQPHGGTNEGFHFPLRASTEVMLSFLGGDPDRPVIAGVLPNALTQSPVAAGNNTMNVIQSGALNRLEMQDLGGSEHVRVQTPNETTFLHMGAKVAGYNLDASTAGDGQWNTGRNWDVTVGADHVKHVVGEVKRTYDASEETKVAANKTTVIGADHTTDVAGVQKTTVEGEVDKAYKKDYTKVVDGKQEAHVKKSYHLKVGPNSTELDIALNGDYSLDNTTTPSGRYDLNLNGPRVDAVKSHYTIKVGTPGKDAPAPKPTPDGSLWIMATNEFKFEADSFKGYYTKQIVEGAHSNWTDYCYGAKIDFWKGPKLEASFDVTLGLHVGVVANFDLGVAFNFNGGVMMDIKAGVCLEVNGAPTFEAKTLVVKKAELEVKQNIVLMALNSIRVGRAGLLVNDNGLSLFK
jgi:type VI secretion system secreted protein VgrG